MNTKIFKRIGIITGCVVAGLYILFLAVPFFLNGIANSCGNYITSVVKDTTGFYVKFENMRFTTTPKLTAGAEIGKLKAYLPNGDEMLTAEKVYGKISLLPLLIKHIEIDTVGCNNVSLSLKVQKDGKFLLEKYLPENEPQNNETSTDAEPVTGLPLGLKLSNKLPDVHVQNYKLSFIDMSDDKQYYIEGHKFNISDFILNKKIKVSTLGKVVFAEHTPFNYDVKIFNKIMPDIDLNDLVFAPQQSEKKEETPQININIIDIFKTINKNMLTADIKTDLTTHGTMDDVNIDGFINIDKISLASDGKPLPDGHVFFTHKGKNITIDSALYTADDQTTTMKGSMVTGKKPSINLTCKSNAQFNNIFNVIDSIAKSVNYKDLDSLSATGGIDADFNIKGDMKKVQSSGYFKIPSASVKYSLYNILIEKIAADIDFSNSMINIKNFGFTVMNQPLKAYGTIKQDTTADLHLIADKLPIKGLLAAAGQVAILKENNINSGTLSMDASLSGKLEKAQPVVNVDVNNINILNKPSNTTIKAANSKVNISTDSKTYKGIIDINSIKIFNPIANLSLPETKISLDEKDIIIDSTSLIIDNSKIDISGEITDYINKNIAINIIAKGNLLASDLKHLIPKEFKSYITSSGQIPVYIAVSGNDKTQNIKAQILATPANYLNIVKVNELSGKNTLINSDIKIANDSLKLANTGIYTTASASLPSDSLQNLLLSVSGSVDKLSSKQLLNNINISTPAYITLEIPGFQNSKAAGKADITLNGSAINPAYKGNISVSDVSIPQIKTSLKNITVDMNPKNIIVNTPTINIDNSVMKAKTIISTNFNNGVIVNNVDFHSDLLDSDTLIKATAGMPAQPSNTSSGNANNVSSNADLGIVIQKGNGTINRFKSGGITATNISSTFKAANNTLYLKGMQGDAFSGKFNGDVSVNLINGNTAIDFHGSNMNAEKAIEGAAGLKNALSGNLGFNAKLTLNGYAPNEAAMMNSIKGNVDFSIKNGVFGNLGRLENLLFAQNIAANGIMNAALTPIVNMPVIKNTANFSSITGEMTLNNGWADIKSIKSSGPSMAAFIYGKYNLVNATANLTILGRLGAEVVKVLGPVGELSVDKLTAFLPKFGTATSKILNAMTTNPKGERISEIPALSGGNTNYKDFKVSFNGGVESKSSVKYFKWLSVCDTSAIEGGSFKDQLKQSQDAINELRQQKKENIQKSVENVKDTAKQTSEDIKNQIQNTKDSINELKNLFKKPSSTTAPAAESTPAPAAP